MIFLFLLLQIGVRMGDSYQEFSTPVIQDRLSYEQVIGACAGEAPSKDLCDWLFNVARYMPERLYPGCILRDSGLSSEHIACTGMRNPWSFPEILQEQLSPETPFTDPYLNCQLEIAEDGTEMLTGVDPDTGDEIPCVVN